MFIGATLLYISRYNPVVACDPARNGRFLVAGDPIQNMTKVEAVIQPAKFEAVKEALLFAGVTGMTVYDVRGHGRQKGHTTFYRGREYAVDLLAKVKIEIVLPDDLVESVVEVILKAASTGAIGDGKIFLSRVDDAIRIRNEQRGVAAL